MAVFTKPMASAGRITSRGHRIVLDDEDAYILHEKSGKNIRFHKKGSVFIMKVAIMPLAEGGACQEKGNAS